MGGRGPVTIALFIGLVAVALPVVHADTPWCDTPYCPTGVYIRDTCAVNATIEGQTCTRAVVVAVRGLAIGTTYIPLSVYAHHDESSGNVDRFNTNNSWNSDTTVVEASGSTLNQTGASLGGYESTQNPTDHSSGRDDREAVVFSGSNEFPAGLDVQTYDGLPRWCVVTTPAAQETVDCSLDPVEELLP